MAGPYASLRRPQILPSLYAGLLSFPIACFSLTVVSDYAYWQTSNLLWLHFSEWLLLAGLVFGVLAAVVLLIDVAVGGARPSWAYCLGWAIVLLLAVLNSFIHTADGWTAVVPFGMLVSVVTFIVMIAVGWLALAGVRHA
jgi:uncharacterized membrane protein